jgi:hypothetical protein
MKALNKSGGIIFKIVTVATENLPQRSYSGNNFTNNQQRRLKNATSNYRNLWQPYQKQQHRPFDSGSS